MDARYLIAGCALALACLLHPGHARAQDSGTLIPFTPVTGTITGGESSTWTFTAAEGTVISVMAEATSGDLDPLVRITNSSGAELIANDDYNYPDTRDALLEAVTLPRRDTYRVIVSGFGSTAGDYRLTLHIGFTDLTQTVTFDDETPLEATNPALIRNISGGQLGLQIGGTQQRGIVTRAEGAEMIEFYARTRVTEITGRSGWLVGMTARQQDARNYYLFQVSHQGQWRFVVRTPLGDRVVRDWAAHPAIAAGEITFSLGILATSSGFDLFYNDLFLNRVSDTTLTEAGRVGLAVETTGALDSEVTALFDELYVTTPLLVDDQPVIPDRLIVSRDGRVMVQELQRRHLIPDAGAMRLQVPESFVTFNRPGVNRISLGGGQTFSSLAMASLVEWEIAGSGLVGCGLVVRGASDTRFTLAYLDQTGGFGVSERQDETFAPGLFGTDTTLTGTTHHLLVIVDGAALRYYVDGRYAGSVDIDATMGSVAGAVVNFETATTSCTFRDTWLWSWD